MRTPLGGAPRLANWREAGPWTWQWQEGEKPALRSLYPRVPGGTLWLSGVFLALLCANACGNDALRVIADCPQGEDACGRVVTPQEEIPQEEIPQEEIVETENIEPESAPISGDPNGKLDGLYSNPKWGKMAIRIDDDNGFLATYDYQAGTVAGTYNPDTGLVKGWWCEIPDRASDAGIAEFEFFQGDSPDLINLDGRWMKGNAGKWNNDWKLTLVKEEIPAELETRFTEEGKFCTEP